MNRLPSFRRCAAVLAAAMLVGAAGCRSTDPDATADGGASESAGAPAPAPTEITVRPGDLLDLFVLDDDQFSGRYLVRPQGDIIVRKIGRVKVAGMSLRAAEASVKRALDAGQFTDARVILELSSTGDRGTGGMKTETVSVFVSGKVLRPGMYEVAALGVSPPTVHQAILQAGDCVRFAHKRKVHILRRGAEGTYERIPADLTAIENGEIQDIRLVSGDTVVVPEKTFGIGP